jgi:hypothetical protein
LPEGRARASGGDPFVGAQISDEKGELQALWPALGFGRLELIEKIKMQTNAPFVPRKALSADLRFDPSLPIFEDWDFWIRLAQKMPFRPVPHLSAVCRLGAGTSAPASVLISTSSARRATAGRSMRNGIRRAFRCSRNSTRR